MASEKDIFEKMDALVRKHHPAATQPAMTTAPPVRPAAAGIPTLTEIIPELTLDADPELDLIPLLTEAIHPPQAQPVVSEVEVELDLDPFFSISAPEPLLPEAELSGEQPPEIVSEKSGIPSFPKSEGPLFTEIIELDAAAKAPLDEVQQETVPAAAVLSTEALAQFSDALSEQLMRALDQRLQQAVDKKIAPQIAQTVDKALSSMLDQFSVNIEFMVREAIAQELQRQLIALLNGSDSSKSEPSSSNSSAHPDDSV